MDRLERFYRIHSLMKAGKCLPLTDFMAEMEVSKATIKRDIVYLRDRLNAPLVFDHDREGYRYDKNVLGADRFNLPGVWFSPNEIHALVVVHALLHNIGPGLFDGTVKPLIGRIEKLLEDHRLPAEEIAKRIRVLNVSHRPALPEHFGAAAQAVIQRQRVKMLHYNRSEDRRLEREVSPQRLIHYRGNWYLDGWCHVRDALRSFALDAIESLHILDGFDADDVPLADLDAFFADAYGIFTGKAEHQAVLKFSAERARWVCKEIWHPKQVGTFEADGSYRLEFPYGQSTELVMDILKHGSAVEVVSPPQLREKVLGEFKKMHSIYQGN